MTDMQAIPYSGPEAVETADGCFLVDEEGNVVDQLFDSECEWCGEPADLEDMRSDPQDNLRCSGCRSAGDYAGQKLADYRSMTR